MSTNGSTFSTLERVTLLLTVAVSILLLLARVSGAQAQTSYPATSPISATGAALISRNGSVTLKVPRYDPAVDAVTRAATLSGADLMDAKTYVDSKGRKHGWMRLRVDSGRFETLRAALRPIGTLFSDAVVAEDQQPGYESLGRRADQLEIHQQRLEGVLNGTRRLRGSDILFIQDRLFRAGTDQQDLLQERADMQRRAAAGLILVELFEPYTMPPPPHQEPPLAQRFKSSYALAHSEFAQLADRSATAAAYALTFAPIWIPLTIVAIVLLSWLWRRRHIIAAWLHETAPVIQSKLNQRIDVHRES